MPKEGDSTGWYLTRIYADSALLQVFGTPLPHIGYQTPPETETERTLLSILDSLGDEERELIWGRYYERMSIRQLTAHMGYTSAGVTQYRIKRTIKKIREAYIERIIRNPS